MRPPWAARAFSDEKGFGFITPDDGGQDAFVNSCAIQADGFRTVAGGAKVQFDVGKAPKGPQARNARLI